MHVILSLKLGDHKGLALLIHVHLLKRTLLVALPAILIQIPIGALPSLVPVCCRGHCRASWCCPAAVAGPNSRKLSVSFVYFVLFLLLILLVILVKLLIFNL